MTQHAYTQTNIHTDREAFFFGFMEKYLMMWLMNIEPSSSWTFQFASSISHSSVDVNCSLILIKFVSYQKPRPASTTGNTLLSWGEIFWFCFCLWQGEQLIKNRPWRDELLCIYTESMHDSITHLHTLRKIFRNFFLSGYEKKFLLIISRYSLLIAIQSALIVVASHNGIREPIRESLLFDHFFFTHHIPSLFHVFLPFSDVGSDSLLVAVASESFVDVPSSWIFSILSAAVAITKNFNFPGLSGGFLTRTLTLAEE